MRNIRPCLMFYKDAEEAVRFYVSLFEDAEILEITHYSANELSRVAEAERPGPAGSVKTISFRLLDQEYLAANGGSHFQFNDAISLYVSCDTQEELDQIWDCLSKDGQIVECGWVIDKFGVRWQVLPAILDAMMIDADSEKRDRVAKAVYSSKKIDFQTLIDAYRGTPSEISPNLLL